MKKLLLTGILLLIPANLIAQSEDDNPWQTPKAADYPAIVASAAPCEGFAPKDWTVTAKVEGDLNGDKLADCVLIVRGTDKKFLNKNEGLGTDVFDTNPRVLVIAFRKADGTGFTLAEQNNRFIIASDSPTMTEPFQEAAINKGVLTFGFEEFYSAGSWGMSNRKYMFRYQSGEFVLIGVDHTSVNRGSGEIEIRSYNLSTGKVESEKGNISDDKKGKITRRKLRIDPKPTLKTIKPMLTWEIEKDVII
jgi:hypothetical protein